MRRGHCITAAAIEAELEDLHTRTRSACTSGRDPTRVIGLELHEKLPIAVY